MKYFNKISAITLVILLCVSTYALAQPTPPGSPADVPIDGGLSILAAAGIAFGAKKAWNSRKKN